MNRLVLGFSTAALIAIMALGYGYATQQPPQTEKTVQQGEPTFGTSGVTNLPYDTGKNGVLRIQQNAAGFQWIATGTAITANRTLTIPDASGVIALGYSASSTNPFIASYFVSTSSSATSTFAFGLQATRLNVTSGTSTFANGLQLNGGCVQVNGVCLSTSSGSNAFTYITTVTATSSTAFIPIPISSTYKTYQLILSNLSPASNAVNLYLRISTTSGSTYAATGYSGCGDVTIAIQAMAQGCAAGISVQKDTSGSGLSGTVFVYNPSSTTTRKQVRGTLWANDTTSNTNGTGDFAGDYNATLNAVNNIQLLFSTGNIATGTVDVYGIKQSN